MLYSAKAPAKSGIIVCAEVSKFHFDNLPASPQPFICWLCSDSFHKAAIYHLQQELASLKAEFAAKIKESQSAIAALKEENTVLQAALKRETSIGNIDNRSSRNEWSRVPHRQRRQPQRATPQGPSPATRALPVTPHASTENILTGASGRSHQPAKARTRSPVHGARKIWGTHPSATAQSVSKTITSLTKVPADITIKRKYKTILSQQSSGRHKLIRWWFVIRGSDDTMKQLDEKWNLVLMQVDWELESLYSYSDATDPGSTVTTESQPSSNPEPSEA